MGTKNATTTSTQQLPGYINDAYKGLISSAGQTASTPYSAYTGGFTPDQQAAFESIRGLTGSGNQAFGASSDAFGRSMVPTSDSVSQYMSPYMDQVIRGAMGNMQEQNAQQQQQVVGNAISKGAMGGNRVGVAQAELGRQQKLADNAAIANLYQSGYGTALGAAQADKTAALQAAQGYAGLGQTQMQTNLAQAASQLGAGTQQQEFDYQQYLNKLAFPYQQQSWLSGIVGGLGSTAGGTTTQQAPAGNMFSQVLGTGLQVASLFSDERLKEGAKVVGRSFDGQPIYSYRYKGSPQTHLGFMAQEVEKKHPEAVGERGGMKTVDYAAATRDAAKKGRFASGGSVPIDIDLARDPARVMRPNPFGMGLDYDASPRLNKPTRRGDWLDMFRAPERDDLDEMWSPMNPITFDRNMREGMASGGVPYMNDNGAWPSFMSRSGSSPYSNDNGGFGSYVPVPVAMGGGGGRFPTIQQPQESQADPLSSSAAQTGAGNIRSWLSPTIAGGAAIPSHGFIPGITGPRLFADGGAVTRNGYAGGGVPMPAYDDLDAFYRGIIYPGAKGGIVGSPEIPPPPPRRPPENVPTIDTVNALDADRLGLGVDMTPERAVAQQGEDPFADQGYGGLDPLDMPRFEKPARVVAGGNAPGEVIYGRGDSFVTRPNTDGYSKNPWEAMQSLFGGKGLNLAPDANHGLMAAGAAMAASRSPFFLQGVGEGTLAGTQAWRDYQAMERENALARANIGQKGEELAQRALQVGAETNVQDATAGSIRAGTAGSIYDYKYTPLGVQVTDKTTGQPGPIYPYGSMMPDGTIAERPADEPMALFSTEVPEQMQVDPRLMTPEGASQAIGVATDVLKTQQTEAQAAQATQAVLQEMKHNLSQLPEDGIMAPGTAFKERANLAKGVNTYLSVFGIDPYFPTGEIAAAEDLNKLTNRLGFDLSKMLGSNEAASVVMTGIESVPGGANSKQGAARIISGLEAANRRRIDLYHYTQNWAAKNGGTILNAEESFNRQNPPELYALSSYVPRGAMEKLMANPQLADAFNAKYGDGKDVARFILGR